MRQRSYGTDTGLTLRMTFTILMLAGLWVIFMGLLFWAGISPILILAFALIGMALQYFMSDKLVLMSTGAREVTPQEEPWLHSTIERLAQMYEIPKPKKIAIMDTHVPNAFATGRNPQNAVVAVTRGLLARLTDREVEAVLGHELAHVKNRDVAVMTWAGLIVIMAGYLMQMLFWMSLFGGFGGLFGGDSDDNDGGPGLMLIMIAVYIGTIIIYFIAQILVMALSRYREYAADRGGAIITGAPMQLASALAKISDDMYRIPDRDLREVRHASALMFTPALSGQGIMSLFSSHPPTEKRIQKLQQMQRELESPRPFRP